MKKTLIAALALLPLMAIHAGNLIDYSKVYVPEEGGIRFEKITDDADCVFSDGLVSRDASSWWAGTQIGLSPGAMIRNCTTTCWDKYPYKLWNWNSKPLSSNT